MTDSLAIPKAACHARSISLPSRSHPLTVSVENRLYSLKASETTSPSSASSVCHNLGALRDLYKRVNDFLQLPLTQQSLSQEQHSRWAEEVLDGSIRLLDVCGAARDVLVQMKESVLVLESSLRRRGEECGLANEVGAYMISRKEISKMVSKCFLNLKRSEKVCSLELLDKDSNIFPIISMFREVEAISLSVLKSVLSYASGMKARSKQSGWSLVSKLVQKRRISSCDDDEDADANEVEKMDGALFNLSTQKFSKDAQGILVQNVLKQVGKLELAIQELEKELEPIFRSSVKRRVCLLNAVNH